MILFLGDAAGIRTLNAASIYGYGEPRRDVIMGPGRQRIVEATRVLGLGTNVSPKKYQETEPSHFIVRGVRFQACSACMKCVEVCPNGAIQVTLDRGVAA